MYRNSLHNSVYWVFSILWSNALSMPFCCCFYFFFTQFHKNRKCNCRIFFFSRERGKRWVDSFALILGSILNSVTLFQQKFSLCMLRIIYCNSKLNYNSPKFDTQSDSIVTNDDVVYCFQIKLLSFFEGYFPIGSQNSLSRYIPRKKVFTNLWFVVGRFYFFIIKPFLFSLIRCQLVKRQFYIVTIFADFLLFTKFKYISQNTHSQFHRCGTQNDHFVSGCYTQMLMLLPNSIQFWTQIGNNFGFHSHSYIKCRDRN